MTPDLKAVYRDLAIAVLRRAVADVEPKKQGNKREPVSSLDRESARKFLDNSEELDFFTDLAGLSEVIHRAGYLTPSNRT